jgi:NAD(P)-dependent dehydrogenase (short-subunit alcohol dehydrogenase family)
VFSLKGKVILVTGATGYLGKAMCLALGQQGATILVNSRSHTKAKILTMELEELGYNATPAIFDVCCEKSINQWLDDSKLNLLHGIVNNAYNGSAGSIETSHAQNFRDSFEVSVVAAQNLFTITLPILRKTVESGHLVSIVSIASMYGTCSPYLELYDSKDVANPPFYGASKAALNQWTKYGACEFSAEGIRFNSLSPGPFPNKDVQEKSPDFVRNLSRHVPMKRVGQANEIGGPIVFLMTDSSSYVNGTNLEVDGGWTTW